MNKKVRIILICIVILIVTAYIVIQKNKPLEFATKTLTEETLVNDFKETGKIKANQQIYITPKYSSKIIFIKEDGDRVEKGDLILKLDTSDLVTKKRELSANISALSGQEEMSIPTLYDSQLQSLNIAIQLAQKQVDELSQDNDKYLELYKSGAIPKSDYEKINRSYEDSKKALALKQNEKTVLIDQSQEKSGSKEFYSAQKTALSVQMSDIDDKISQSEVYAPLSGIVTNVSAKNGGFANSTMPIMEISASDDIIAVCDVLSSDALALKENQKVEILQKIGEDTIKKSGLIIEIGKYAKTKMSSLGLEEQRVEIKIKLDDVKNIIVGSDIDIIFETLRLDNVLIVPKSAVFEYENDKYVWKVQDGKLAKAKIETGHESDYEYEVISGLSQDDIIIMEANNAQLKEGIKVKSKESK